MSGRDLPSVIPRQPREDQILRSLESLLDLPGTAVGLHWSPAWPLMWGEQSLWLRGLVILVPLLQMRFHLWSNIPARYQNSGVLLPNTPRRGHLARRPAGPLQPVCSLGEADYLSSFTPLFLPMLSRHIFCSVIDGLFIHLCILWTQNFECLLCTSWYYMCIIYRETSRSMYIKS